MMAKEDITTGSRPNAKSVFKKNDINKTAIVRRLKQPIRLINFVNRTPTNKHSKMEKLKPKYAFYKIKATVNWLNSNLRYQKLLHPNYLNFNIFQFTFNYAWHFFNDHFNNGSRKPAV